MSENVEKRIFGGNPSPSILKKLNLLQKQTGSFSTKKDKDFLSSRDPVFDDYLGGKTPFARMWTATAMVPSGSHITGSDTVKVFHSVNENRNFSYKETLSPSESVNGSYRVQNEKNPYFKPTSGITSISSKSEGALGALRTTSVEFEVHNKRDFETIFLPFFLRPGALICVDFGWSSGNFKLYDPQAIIKDNMTMESFDMKIQQKVRDNLGDLEVVIGIVRKYDASITELGSFKCTVEIVSRNYSLLDAEISEENSLKFIFANMIDQVLIRILTTRAGFEEENPLMEFHNLTQNPFSHPNLKEANKKFFDTLIVAREQQWGKLTANDLIRGIYYADVTDENAYLWFDYSSNVENEVGAEAEALYVSYGLFEDVFLNNFVKSVWTVDDEEGVTSKSDGESLTYGFDSRKSKIQWNENLYEIQRQPKFKNEGLHVFMMPKDWTKSYNSKHLTKEEQEKIYANDFNNGLMPLRELFIKTALISEAFQKKQNVNDALEYIWDKISEESKGAWKIKMASPKKELITKQNTSGDASEVRLVDIQSQIGFYDINQSIKEPVELVFDLTSGNGFVKSADIKFQTPKAGMASMIAISNMSYDKVFFKESAYKKLSLLKLLDDKSQGKKIYFKSLPDMGNPDPTIKEYQVIDVDLTDFTGKTKSVDGAKATDIYNKKIGGALEAYNKEVERILKDKDGDGEVDDKEKNAYSTAKEIFEEDKIVLIANSPSEYSLALAEKANMSSYRSNDVSPILPVELELTTYGNNLLHIGDVFDINYLPEHYKNKVYFQTMGIDHKVSSAGWETTYNSMMRPNPDELSKISVDPETVIIKMGEHYSKKQQSNQPKGLLDGISSTTKMNDHRGFEILTNFYDVNSEDELGQWDDGNLFQRFNIPKNGAGFALIYAYQFTLLSSQFTKWPHAPLPADSMGDVDAWGGRRAYRNLPPKFFMESVRGIIDDMDEALPHVIGSLNKNELILYKEFGRIIGKKWDTLLGLPKWVGDGTDGEGGSPVLGFNYGINKWWDETHWPPAVKKYLDADDYEGVRVPRLLLGVSFSMAKGMAPYSSNSDDFIGSVESPKRIYYTITPRQGWNTWGITDFILPQSAVGFSLNKGVTPHNFIDRMLDIYEIIEPPLTEALNTYMSGIFQSGKNLSTGVKRRK